MRILSVAVTALVALGVAGCVYPSADDSTPAVIDARQHVNRILDEADWAHAHGDDVGAQRLRDAAHQEECHWFGCPSPAGTTTVTMDPTATAPGGFFAMPWPSDTRRQANGSLDLTGFPGTDTIPIANIVLTGGAASTFGFGENSGLYFQASAPIDPASLPTPDESTHRRSNAMLVDLDHPGSPPAPLLADVKATGTALRPANLVTFLPYPGHPLASHTRYAMVLFAGLLDTGGNRLSPSPLIGALDGATPAGTDPARWTRLRTDRDEARTAVRVHTLWHPSELVAFSVFTTQDTTSEMAAITTAVNALPPPQVIGRTLDPNPCVPGGVAHSTARLALPRWQEGTSPYISGGGGTVIIGGTAQQQGVELGTDGQGVKLDMAIPCGPAPAAGWPILLWMNGTGGSARATPISQLGPTVPYAVFSIAPIYSGDRTQSGPAPFDTPEMQFFNFVNPVAGRTNQLQQAADMLYLKRIAQNLVLDPSEGATIDPGLVVMAGHSQGALTLPITLASDPTVRGAFLSSGGAGLYHSIVHRSDIRPLVDGLLGAQPGELDIFHPYLQVLQTFSEVGDAANYAGRVQTTDVVVYAGLRDGCSPIETSVHLASALGIPVAHPVTRQPVFASLALEPPTVVMPVSQNLADGRTGVMVEVDDGHFGASTYPAIGRSFIDSIATTGHGIVSTGPLDAHDPGSSCTRFDPPPVP